MDYLEKIWSIFKRQKIGGFSFLSSVMRFVVVVDAEKVDYLFLGH